MKAIILNLILILSAACAHAQSYITVYTKFGNPVQGIIRTEMSAREKSEALAWVAEYYPNATVLSEASRLYNCHSYAWNMQDGGATCWINATNSSGADNVSKYWAKGEYYAETTQNNATKIHYYNGDHSAISSPTVNGKYISKWGELPLMLHSPDYCPYTTGRKYYCKRNFLEGSLKCSVPDRGVLVGEEADYYLRNDGSQPMGPTLDCRWSVVDTKNYENIIGTIASVTVLSTTTARISFNRAGLYIITCDIYMSGGEYVSSYTIEGVVEN